MHTSHDSMLSSEPLSYVPLIEALYQWQTIFELALDQAAQHLSADQFPAEELKTSLADMCELLREVLEAEEPITK